MSTISASAARQTLPAQLDRVEKGEEVAITRHGRVVAVLVRPDTLKARRAPEAWSRADHIGDLLESARGGSLRHPTLSPERAEELVEAIRVEKIHAVSVVTAFDADVLIYAAAKGHPIGARVAALFAGADAGAVGTGSVLLLAEVLTKPMSDDPDSEETATLVSLLSRLELHPLDETTARLALALAISYSLRAADAAHLATAVAAEADRFLTNNRKDFPRTITEIDVVYPDELPAVASTPA